MRKLVPIAVAVGVVVASGGVFGTATAFAKDIKLTVDNQPVDVRTWSGTVGDVLRANNISLSERDTVYPARTEAVKQGEVVSVRHARQVNLTLDGRQEQLWTQALTVSELLELLGVREESVLSVPADSTIPRSGLDLTIDSAREVRLVQAGQSRQIITTKDTVADVLAEAGVQPGPKDVVAPAPTTAISDGLEITVANQDVRLTTKTIDVPFKEVRRDDPTLPKGTEKVDIEGVVGKIIETWEEKLINGQSVEKKMTSSREQVKAVDKVILVGTGDGTATPTASPSAGASPAPKGDLSPARGETCTASMYDEPQMTATGERFNPEAMTAAHKTVKLNSNMKVTNPKTGKTVIVRINDRGPYVGGRCIDLSRAAFRQLGDLGQGLMQVTIEPVR